MLNVTFPYKTDAAGATATCTYSEHVKQMVRQLLLTSPGERVNRPTFGCGFGQLLFEPNTEVLAATLQLLVQSSLQQWLGHIIDVVSVEIASADSELQLTVQYVIRSTATQDKTTVVRSI